MVSASLLTRALAIIGLAVIIGAVHSLRTPVELRLRAANGSESEGPSAAAAPTEPSGPGLNITIAQAWDLFQRGVPFIDARLKKEYEQGRVMGAFHNPPAGGLRPDVVRFLDPAQPVVIYCGGGDCKDSENLAILLRQMGFTRLHIMTDGFPAWQAAGHPVEAGGGP
jgi:rhodanese-related sulfurtransferase